MEIEVQKEISVLILWNEEFQNVHKCIQVKSLVTTVSHGEKSINKSKKAFTFQKIEGYTLTLNNTSTISSFKLTHIAKCINLLAEQVAKEDMMLIFILRNRNSRFSAKMQLFCMTDNIYYNGTFVLRHISISNSQHTVNYFLWILNCNFTIDYSEGSTYNSSFKGSWKVDVQIFYHNEFEASSFRVGLALNSLSSNSSNHNVCNSNFKHNRINLKETSKTKNKSSFIEKKNSRKNRFLLSVNSESNPEEKKRDINTSQKARHARNKEIPLTNNQRDSPNGNLYATKVEHHRKRKSRRRLAKDLTFAAEAKRAKSSSSQEEADTTKRAARISFSTDNETDYRREIDRQIEADFAKIKDILRLEKANVISSAEISQWPSNNAAKNNRQSVSLKPTIDTQEPEIIIGKRVCIAPHCQQVIQHGVRAKSPDSNELPANSRSDGGGKVASEQNGIAVASRKVVDKKIQLGNDNDNDNERKLVGEALIILNKDASPLTIVEKSNDSNVNLKYSVKSISLGLDEFVKMGKEVMKKKKLDNNAGQNETKRTAAGLSRKNCLKYAKRSNETYRGLEDDEGMKLEEQLKELRGMHIQRKKQGFTNSAGKNEMRFAAGDEYTFRNDEAARLHNEYSRGHVRQRKKRCRRKKHKSSPILNTSLKKSNLIQNEISYQKKIKKSLQNSNNDVPFNDTLANSVTKTSSRIKKDNPYRKYEESSAEEKLLPDKNVVEYSTKKTSRETHSPSKNEKVSERKIEITKDSHVKSYKSSRRFIPRKTRSYKIIKKNMCNRQPSSMSQSMNKTRSQIKKKNKLPQSLSSRKLKSVQAGRILCELSSSSKNDTLFRDISNYSGYDDLEKPTNSFDQILENRKTIANAPSRKLLSSNSMEYDEGSPISANKESKYDYVEKFYGDQPYEKGPHQLHYFQINLRNVTLQARIEGEALRIELAQYQANKSMETTSANHQSVSKTRYPKRTLKSVEQEEQLNDYFENKGSVKDLYLLGDLISYNYDPKESDEKEKFKKEMDENEDPDLARLFANGQEYDINVRGKLHLRLKDPESNIASEKSSKKKRSARPKIGKSREELAQTERKFAVDDKRTKRNPDKDSTDIYKEDGNLESKVSNKMRNPLKKISDFFKRKFPRGGSNKKKFRKKLHAKAKIVRIKPERRQGEDISQSTFPPSCEQSTTNLKSRRSNCKCTLETMNAPEFTTDTPEATDYITQSTESHASITENNESNYGVYSKNCHCRERSTEMSSIIIHATPQYVTNRPETDYSSTKAQLSYEIVSEESTEAINTTSLISTNGQTEKTAIIPSNHKSSESSSEQQAKVKNVAEILNFIKNLEKLLKDQKVPFRIGDENGGVEIKLEKIYIRPGKNQSIVELKNVSETDQKEDISNVGDTSEVIRQSNAERSILSLQDENAQSLSNQNTKFLSNAVIKNDLNENIFDETSQTIEKPKKYDNAILEAYIEASVPKSSQADKNASNNKSLPAKQWIDEQRIASNDQSLSRGRNSTSRDRMRKKRRRKKRRRRLRKRNVNESGIASKKGKAPYRLRRRRRRGLSTT